MAHCDLGYAKESDEAQKSGTPNPLHLSRGRFANADAVGASSQTQRQQQQERKHEHQNQRNGTKQGHEQLRPLPWNRCENLSEEQHQREKRGLVQVEEILQGKFRFQKKHEVLTKESCPSQRGGQDPLIPAERVPQQRLERLQSLQMRYLMAFVFMSAGDWLQGPYMYALYEAYGFRRKDIRILFISGFCASFSAGTIVGSLADKYGRKRMCMLYALIHIAACLMKHSSKFSCLLLGRMFGGTATSLLMSVFDSWLVSEHKKINATEAELGFTFSLVAQVNSVVAIGCGVVAQCAVDRWSDFGPTSLGETIYAKGYLVPFDVAIVCLTVGMAFVFCLWDENYGNRETHRSELQAAARLVLCNNEVIATGLVQGLFEASMYSFIFMWTPSLGSDLPLPHGAVFAMFMLFIMFGSQLYRLVAGYGATPEGIVAFVCALAAVSLLIVPTGELLEWSSKATICGFCVFEICVGMYFPAMATIKSKVVPEMSRSAIYNLFRVPLNVIVVGILAGDFSVTSLFVVCSVLLFFAAITSLSTWEAKIRREMHRTMPFGREDQEIHKHGKEVLERFKKD